MRTETHEPLVPDIVIGDTGQPLCCETCGRELELRCGAGHRHKKNVGDLGPAPIARTKSCRDCGASFEPRRFQRRCDACERPPARSCTKCGAELTPRQRRCLVCKPITAPVAPAAPRGDREYRTKVCAGCGAEFMPTGPRALRCARCRGAAA